MALTRAAGLQSWAPQQRRRGRPLRRPRSPPLLPLRAAWRPSPSSPRAKGKHRQGRINLEALRDADAPLALDRRAVERYAHEAGRLIGKAKRRLN